jgi:hypothetical protein
MRCRECDEKGRAVVSIARLSNDWWQRLSAKAGIRSLDCGIA